MADAAHCFVCAKHAEGDAALGGVIYDDGVVYAGHAHPMRSPDVYLGYVAVEPRRHIAKLGDLTDDEAARVGWLTNRLSRALRELEGAEHVYGFVFGDGLAQAHLHLMLVPRYPGTPDEYRGLGAVRLREWQDAPRGGAEEMRAVCSRLAATLRTQDDG